MTLATLASRAPVTLRFVENRFASLRQDTRPAEERPQLLVRQTAISSAEGPTRGTSRPLDPPILTVDQCKDLVHGLAAESSGGF